MADKIILPDVDYEHALHARVALSVAETGIPTPAMTMALPITAEQRDGLLRAYDKIWGSDSLPTGRDAK